MAGAEIRVLGDAELAAELRAAGPLIRERMLTAIRAEGALLASYIAKSKLSGQLVQVRTGRLVRGMTSKLLKGQGDTGPIVVAVYDQASKRVAGKTHRYGFMLAAGAKGIPKVREHQRRVRSRDMYGTTIDLKTGRRRRRIVMKGTVTVKAHRRDVEFKGRPIFDDAMNERADGIHTRLRAVIGSALREAKLLDGEI